MQRFVAVMPAQAAVAHPVGWELGRDALGVGGIRGSLGLLRQALVAATATHDQGEEEGLCEWVWSGTPQRAQALILARPCMQGYPLSCHVSGGSGVRLGSGVRDAQV